MWQQWIVGLIVLAAVLYAAWYWMPAAWRRPLGRIRKQWGQAPGCGACSDCASSGCATAAKPAAAAAPDASGRTPMWMRSER